jgi:hypothetical protein
MACEACVMVVDVPWIEAAPTRVHQPSSATRARLHRPSPTPRQSSPAARHGASRTQLGDFSSVVQISHFSFEAFHPTPISTTTTRHPSHDKQPSQWEKPVVSAPALASVLPRNLAPSCSDRHATMRSSILWQHQSINTETDEASVVCLQPQAPPAWHD